MDVAQKTSDLIDSARFTQGFRGYDTMEVDNMLDDQMSVLSQINTLIDS